MKDKMGTLSYWSIAVVFQFTVKVNRAELKLLASFVVVLDDVYSSL
jgi:hypothetical protein